MINNRLIERIKQGKINRLYFSRILWNGTCIEYNNEANRLISDLAAYGMQVCVNKDKCHDIFHTLPCETEDGSKNFIPLLKDGIENKKTRDSIPFIKCLYNFEISSATFTDGVIEVLRKTSISICGEFV